MQARFKRKIYPEPGILGEKGKGWKIEENAYLANVSMTERIMSVPLSKSEEDCWVRTHEMAHIRFSPDSNEVKGIPTDFVLAIEDFRVNTLINERGIDIPDKTSKNIRLQIFNPIDALLFGLSSRYSPYDEEGLKLISQFGNIIVKTKTINELFQFANDYMESAIEEDTIKNFSTTEGLCKTLFNLIKSSDDDSEKDKLYAEAIKGSPLKGRWGEMVLENPPLFPKKGGYLLKVTKSSDEGIYIRTPERLLLDGKIFGKRKKVKGGTVLIDASSSMGMKEKDIQELVDRIPNATIFMYGSGKYEGTLRCIAKSGRVSRDLYSPGDYNVIDGPALQYISKLEEPRFWISDGIVTGLQDHCHMNLTNEAFEICTENRIKVFSTLEKLLGYLKR